MAIKKKSPEAQNWVVKEHACQHTAATRAQLRLNWDESISQTQLFPQVTQSQTDPDWIHYYAWMGGGGVEWRGQTQSEFRLQSESRICWEMHTDHLSVDLCVECVCGGFSFACDVYAVRVLVSVCVITPLRNQFPPGCAKDSDADVWFVKLERSASEILSGGPPEPSGVTSVIPWKTVITWCVFC